MSSDDSMAVMADSFAALITVAFEAVPWILPLVAAWFAIKVIRRRKA